MGRRMLVPFPEVEGNAVEPIELGEAYFERMLAAIAGAERCVDVQMYLWDDDPPGRAFLEALREAAGRGLMVRVLVDAVGARHVVGAPLVRVAHAGGEVRVFNPFRLPFLVPFYHRTHKKLLLVDGTVGYCGGAGFSSSFSLGKGRERPWHDRMFEVRGPVVEQLGETFDVDFSRWGPRRTPSACAADHAACVPAGGSRARVLRGWPDSRDYPTALLQAVHDAKSRVLIGTPYFIPRFRLLAALIRAQRRGVDVELVLPSREHANAVLWAAGRRTVKLLLRQDVAVFEFAPSFYHAKIAIVDEAVALVGSSNLDGWSWRRNAELDLAFTDPPTVRRLAACFEADRDRSNVVTLATYRRRSFLGRLYERIARLLSGWM